MADEEPILWDVVEEHLDESEFLVEAWLTARASASYTLQELGDGPEARLLAHIDGLVVNGPAALEEMIWPILAEDAELPRMAAACLALLEAGQDRALDALAAEEPPETLGPGMSVALSLCAHPKVGDWVRGRLPKAEGLLLTVLLQACADHGLDPGAAVERGLVHEDVAVQEAALRASTYGDRRRLLGAVESRLQHPEPAVQAAALETALVWNSRSAWQLVMHLALQSPEPSRSVLTWVACFGTEQHAAALVKRLEDEALRHDTIWALGFSGRVPAVDACIKLLDHEDETTRRLAGEAVAAILGLDPDDETLWEEDSTEEPDEEVEGDDPAEDEDDLEAELVEQPDDEPPLPNAQAIREVWAKTRSGFAPSERRLLGKPVGREGPGWTLGQLSCRRVDFIAREVVARSQGVGRWLGRNRSHRSIQAAGALEQLGRQTGVMQGGKT
ncbi:MAG: hypothetical protein AAF799_05775 [Myxococcota bacterium]